MRYASAAQGLSPLGALLLKTLSSSMLVGALSTCFELDSLSSATTRSNTKEISWRTVAPAVLIVVESLAKCSRKHKTKFCDKI